jgi:hypothetical protein
MKHLDDAAAVAIAEGSKDPKPSAHLAECARCRKLVDDYRHLLDVAEACDRPPEGLQRWARAYARLAAPAKPTWRALSFIARGGALVAAVRGGEAISQAVLYGDERHQLDMRFEPSPGGKARLHGQLVPLQDDAVEGWSITAVLEGGDSRSTRTDAGGEFWLEGLAWGEGLSLVAEGETERIVVARVLAGECVGEGT